MLPYIYDPFEFAQAFEILASSFTAARMKLIPDTKYAIFTVHKTESPILKEAQVPPDNKPTKNGAKLAIATRRENIPCVVPRRLTGTALYSDANVGPIQHSATRYSTNKLAAATDGLSANMNNDHAGIARRLPIAGTHSLDLDGSKESGVDDDNLSAIIPPSRLDINPPTVMMKALLLENNSSLPGYFSKTKGAFHMAIVKPAAKRRREANNNDRTSGILMTSLKESNTF